MITIVNIHTKHLSIEIDTARGGTVYFAIRINKGWWRFYVDGCGAKSIKYTEDLV